MKKLNSNNFKLVIQKKGRLADDSVEFLRSAGFIFEAYTRSLFTKVRNFPLEIVFARDDDIPDYVQSGVVDLGIVGQNLLNEYRSKVKKLLNLQFCYCALCLCVPKESAVQSINDLKGKTIATSYPQSTGYFLKANKISATIRKISGSVEISPALGTADAIVDLVSTGSTLASNDLRIVSKLYSSEAVLICNSKAVTQKSKKIDELLLRFKGVLSAKNYKYITMNAPIKILPKLKKAIPGLKSPTVAPLAREGWISVGSVIKEDIFWETIEKLKRYGASEILVSPIEKLII